MRHIVISAVLAGAVSFACTSAREEARADESPQPVPVQQHSTVSVHVDRSGYDQWRQRQIALEKQRQAQLQQAQADREAAARNAAEAQARADELQRQAASESSARTDAQARADAARQQANAAQSQLSQRESELKAAQNALVSQQAQLKASADAQAKQQQELDRQRAELQQREQQLKTEEQAKNDAEARARKALEQVASVKQEARGMVVTLNGSVLFAFDEASLLPDAKRRLDVVADVLKQAPDEQFRVEGYTDAIGDDSYNLQLSQRRADSVKSYLVSRGVSPEQIASLGYGENRPVADNGSPEGRANNRRVEIVLPNEGAKGVGGSGSAGTSSQQKVNDEQNQNEAPPSKLEDQSGKGGSSQQPEIDDNGADFDAR
ncbi:MAG: OmpA family protein [Myxococcaceae bacterium]